MSTLESHVYAMRLYLTHGSTVIILPHWGVELIVLSAMKVLMCLEHTQIEEQKFSDKSETKKLARARYVPAGFSLWEAKDGSPSEDYPISAVCFEKHRNSAAPPKPRCCLFPKSNKTLIKSNATFSR